MTERVDHPPHYGGVENPHEPIKVIEHYGLSFCLGNAVKYILRAPLKGAELEDLKKARWYLDREIARMEDGAAELTWEWTDADFVVAGKAMFGSSWGFAEIESLKDALNAVKYRLAPSEPATPALDYDREELIQGLESEVSRQAKRIADLEGMVYALQNRQLATPPPMGREPTLEDAERLSRLIGYTRPAYMLAALREAGATFGGAVGLSEDERAKLARVREWFAAYWRELPETAFDGMCNALEEYPHTAPAPKQRLQALADKAGPLPSGVLAVGEPAPEPSAVEALLAKWKQELVELPDNSDESYVTPSGIEELAAAIAADKAGGQ
jgi:hypothetical protein